MTVKKPLVMNQPQVGKLMRELRLKTGLTQEQFTTELGVTYSSINRDRERTQQAFTTGDAEDFGDAAASGRSLSSQGNPQYGK